MKRWIVNAAERTVREVKEEPTLMSGILPGEFFLDGTYADAMAAGQRRRLAEEALKAISREHEDASGLIIVGDRIEPKSSDTGTIKMLLTCLCEDAPGLGFDVWREGTGLVVLGRLP